jgi:UDP-N-acetylmuramate dehydrogenase
MMAPRLAALSGPDLALLEAKFGAKMQAGFPLEKITSARVGGPADALVRVETEMELAEAAAWLWNKGMPFCLVGGGSNILVSDAGVRGVVIHNQTRKVVFREAGEAENPVVWAESGANFGMLARLAAQRGLSGLEWAAGIPGTLGGAIFGNAGAHGKDMSSNLFMATILQQTGNGKPVRWTCDQFKFAYRSSILKRSKVRGAFSPSAVILSAELQLKTSTPEAVQSRMDEYTAFRRRTQPPGASMGSMFKNPAGDFAGRLIDQAGLKGTRIGQAEISPLHGNFFINHGNASARDILELIQLAQRVVLERTHVQLELEIELLGEW